MPEYTQNSSIPYPGPGDPIRGNTTDNIRTDLRDLALAADRADVQTRVDAVQDAQIAAQPRYAFLESLAAEPGSRVVNLVVDPLPTNPSETHNSGRVSLASAPGWGRAIADGSGATSIIPHLQQPSSTGTDAPATPGQDVAFTIQLRAMPGQALSATVYMISLTGGSSQGAFLTTEQLDLDPNQSRTFSASGTVPAGADSVRLLITFRRYGETYAQSGDFLYWRRTGVYVGNAPTPLSYTTGDGDYSYWLGAPNRSGSVTMRPKASGHSGDALRRSTIIDAGIKRRGGRIGTGGKAAVALRFDHHFDQFNDKVMPLLREYRLPWGQMVNIGRFGTGNDNLSVSQVADLCYTSGGELWNHGYSHTDMPDETTAAREITQGLDDLKAEFPGLWIDGWAGPGQTDMMGMEGSDTPEKFYDTYPGRLVLAQHAFVRGYYPGVYQRMAGPNLVGAPHSTIDKLDYSYVSGMVRGAVEAQAGLTLMLHPNYLDQSGYMSTETLEQCFAYIAQLRDEGDLVVLSPTGILVADSGAADRWNLLTTGQAGSLSGTWTENVSTRLSQAQYGVPHELTVHVRAASAGTTTLSLTETGSAPRFEQQHSISLNAGEFTTLRCLATFPRDTAGITASLSGNVEHSAISLHAV